MAEIRPLNAIHYAPDVPLNDVVAPPYDVIDAEQRAALLARSRHNILTPAFREVGVGVAFGAPSHDGGATYTTDFGARG